MQVRLRSPDRVEDVAGPLRVDELLGELDIAPHTVLVIVDGQLVTGSHVLADDATVEVRPVISGGSDAVPRCAECRATAVIEERRHRAAWCAAHYPDHVARQVRRAIDRPPGQAHDGSARMFSYADRVLVAVSGGKDSLALWDILLEMGYRVDGLYVGLGIGGYRNRYRPRDHPAGVDIVAQREHAHIRKAQPRIDQPRAGRRDEAETLGLGKPCADAVVDARRHEDVLRAKQRSDRGSAHRYSPWVWPRHSVADILQEQGGVDLAAQPLVARALIDQPGKGCVQLLTP